MDRIKVAEIHRVHDTAELDTETNWFVIELKPEATALFDSAITGARIRLFNLSDSDLGLIKTAIESDQKVRAAIKENI